MARKKGRGRRSPWYKMDNAGVLYSAIQKEKYSAVYRFSAVMDQIVEPKALQRAVERTVPRFPGFAVRVRRGAFWYYFEPNTAPGPFVKKDISNPCQPIRFKEDNGWLIRVYYYQQRISLEVFHALSDGAGALVLFRTLLAVYLRELGYQIPNGDGVLNVDEPPAKEELEDAYVRHATVRARFSGWNKKAYQNTGTPEPFYTLNVTMGFVPVDKLKERAKFYGVSITEYLSGILLKVILENQDRERPHRPKQVALAIPINLRPWFPSETLRNFILTVRPYIDPVMGEYTFAEILSQVHHYVRLHVNRQEMQSIFTGNVRFTTNKFLQILPIWFKNPIMSISYRLLGTRPYSATYTNPGIFAVPKVMEPHIQRMEVILGQATNPRVHCASISYGNTMVITFAGTLKETDTEREFFRFLVREGIPVKVESNRTVRSELLF